jgi:RNase P/RNase MRP subunit p29
VAAAVAGLVVGVVGYHLATLKIGPEESIDGVVTGTIGRVQNDLRIDLEGVRGVVSFRQDNTLAISEVDISSQREVELHLEYEGRSIEFRAAGDIDSPLHDISLAGNTIVVRNLGAAEYVATFYRQDGASTPLRVRVVSGGELLLDEEIPPGRLR